MVDIILFVRHRGIVELYIVGFVIQLKNLAPIR
jgi:hypothetical protein